MKLVFRISEDDSEINPDRFRIYYDTTSSISSSVGVALVRQARSWIRFTVDKRLGEESTLRYKNTIYNCKNLLDRPKDMVVTVVGVEVYPVRYVNPTDLP
jgi:hypothetical protein